MLFTREKTVNSPAPIESACSIWPQASLTRSTSHFGSLLISASTPWLSQTPPSTSTSPEMVVGGNRTGTPADAPTTLARGRTFVFTFDNSLSAETGSRENGTLWPVNSDVVLSTSFGP